MVQALFFSGLIAAGALITQIIMGISAPNDYQQVVVAYEEGQLLKIGYVEKTVKKPQFCVRQSWGFSTV